MDNDTCKVLIPACGRSERFREVTPIPKGLIKFNWRRERKAMIEHIATRLPEHWEKWVVHRTDEASDFRSRLPSAFNLMGVRSSVGQADTVRHGLSTVHADQDFVVLNSDNAIDLLDKSVNWFRSWHADCGAVVFDEPKMSGGYGYIDQYPHFTRGVEKQAISQYALAGAFYFKNRGVFEQAYAGAVMLRRAARDSQEIYISSMFEHVRGIKIASWIDRRALHEWGSWQQLQDDKSVTIDWSNA